MQFCPISRENAENQAKMLETCFLKIAISQDWVNEFQISQSLWVREALEHILRLSRFHNSCEQNICVTKTPKIHLFIQFHITGTVPSFISKYCIMKWYQLAITILIPPLFYFWQSVVMIAHEWVLSKDWKWKEETEEMLAQSLSLKARKPKNRNLITYPSV